MKKDQLISYTAGILSFVIFGFSFMMTKIALPAFGGDIFHLLSYRFVLGAAVMGILRLAGVIRPRYGGKPMGQLFLLALIQPVLYFICETLGLRLIPSSQAGLMIALIPIAVTILGAVFLREKPTWVQTLFILVSVGGVMLINLAGGLNSGGSLLGILFVGGAVLTAAAYSVLSRRASRIFLPAEITWVMLYMGAVVFTSVMWGKIIARGLPWQAYFAPLADLEGMLVIAYLSVVSSVAAFFLLNYLLSRLEAARTAAMANITTLVSVFAGVLILHEPFGWFHAVGSALILAGVWGVNRFRRRPMTEEEIAPIAEAPPG